jgi:hypothetical protein
VLLSMARCRFADRFISQQVVGNHLSLGFATHQPILCKLPSLPLYNLHQVLVTGAGGRTGAIVMKKLLERDEFTPRGVVRSDKVGEQSREEEE